MEAQDGKIAILQFHGVPDNDHPWVHTPEENFRAFMKYLQLNKYQVIALRDLAKYVDPQKLPERYDENTNQRESDAGRGECKNKETLKPRNSKQIPKSEIRMIETPWFPNSGLGTDFLEALLRVCSANHRTCAR